MPSVSKRIQLNEKRIPSQSTTPSPYSIEPKQLIQNSYSEIKRNTPTPGYYPNLSHLKHDNKRLL